MGREFHATHMLDSNKIGADERNVIDLAESADNTRMVNWRNQNSQKVGQEGRLFLEVEGQRLVITVSDISKHIFPTIPKPTSQRWQLAQSRP